MVNINIANSSPVPLYEQITDQIKEHILRERLVQGEALPSIRQLARELQVSIITTKRAYEELERQGFITTVAGKGSFVAVQNRERLREMRIREMEQLLEQAVAAARSIDLSKEECLQILELLYEEEV